MGLGLIEMVMEMEMEEAFDLSIPDQDAERIRTIGDAIDYVLMRRSDPGSQFCATQRSFYRIRRGAISSFGVSRDEVAPSTRWDSISTSWKRRWRWNRLCDASGLNLPRPRAEESLASTARMAVERFPEQFGQKLERDEVARIVRALTAKAFSTTSFDDDTRFVDLDG